MTKIKVKYRFSSVKGNVGTIYYQIISGRQTRQISTNYRVFAEEWNERLCMLVSKPSSPRISLIREWRERMNNDLARFTRIVKLFETKELDYNAEDVAMEYRRQVIESSFFNFMESVIVTLRQNGNIRTSETYNMTLGSFKAFRNDEDIMFDDINGDVIVAYQAYLRNKGVTPNTVSFYMRILRATYNRAVEKGLVEQKNPFRHVYTGIERTIKRAVPISVIRKIKRLDLSDEPTLDYARDIFMLSFYLRGMSFVDMAFLRKTDLKNGHVIYRRRKTRQLLSIKWTPEMQTVLNKYPENPSDYLFPIIGNEEIDERMKYSNENYRINRALKRIAKLIGVKVPLTMYVARHSWASAAKKKGIPIGVISEGMGHDSETTTQIYLASLDVSVVDRANSKILKLL